MVQNLSKFLKSQPLKAAVKKRDDSRLPSNEQCNEVAWHLIGTTIDIVDFEQWKDSSFSSDAKAVAMPTITLKALPSTGERMASKSGSGGDGDGG